MLVIYYSYLGFGVLALLRGLFPFPAVRSKGEGERGWWIPASFALQFSCLKIKRVANYNMVSSPSVSFIYF